MTNRASLGSRSGLLALAVLVAAALVSSCAKPSGTMSGGCPAGLASCGGKCVDQSTDVANCGACGTGCAAGQQCQAGACKCLAGLTACGASCAALMSDPAHCGSCAQACGASQVCDRGTCSSSCSTGLTACSGGCVALGGSDPFNCGACGKTCPAGQSCSAGTCGCPMAGQAMCGSSCVDVMTSAANCGSCGKTCAATQTCTGGACVCPSGQMTCPNGTCAPTGQCSGGGGAGGGSGDGGGTGGAGGGATDGPAGEVGPVCSNTDKTLLAMDATAFVPAACNNYGIQGAWYCFADPLGTTTSSPNCAVTGAIPYNTAQKAMCVGGTTLTGGSYGAAIGIELNHAGGATAKMPFDATAKNIVGFEITITGSTGSSAANGVALRVSFTTGAATTTTQPFVALPGPGTYQVLFKDAVAASSVGGNGVPLNPNAIYDVQISIPHEAAATPFSFCVTELKPILGPVSAPTACGALAAYGSPVCGTQDVLGEVGNYGVQNNVFAGANGGQCVAAINGGNCAGFTATFNNFGNGGNNPWSFPSMVYGWHMGAFYGGYKTPRRLSAITSVMSSWNWSAPSGGKWDVVYDIWLDSANTNPTAPGASTTEFMIWMNYSGVNPSGGSAKATGITIPGTTGTWEVWQNNIGWNYVAYKRPAGDAPFQNVDLKQFFNEAANRGYITTSGASAHYLLGVQAGFEVWGAGQGGNAKTNSFGVTVN